MSKGNMLLGHARGKVGSLVFSRVNGQQITRARAEQVKNPQTQAQTIQRILLNTVSQAYSYMSGITDHSFEGIAAGQASMSFFMKRNLNLLREILADSGDWTLKDPEVSPIGQAILCANEYEISKGSLPAVNPSGVANNGIDVVLSANSYKAIIDKFGLQRGDQLTFCIMQGTSAADMAFRYARIILDPKNEDGSDAPLTTALVDANGIVKPNGRNEINDFTFSWIPDALVAGTETRAIMGCIIASRQKENGEWLRSTSSMVAADYEGYGVSIQDALDAFYGGNVDVTNPRFLNNANKGFKQQQAGVKHYNVSLSANPSAAGEVSGAGRYEEGATVTISAVANEGYRFVRWEENHVIRSTDPSYSFTVNKNRSLVAVFVAVVTVSVTTSADPAAGGNTTGGGNVEQGTECTVVATPNSGYKFKRWEINGSQVSTSASYTFTANENTALVAKFEEVVTVAIQTSSSPAAGGSTSGGGNIEQGSSCTIVATPASGYRFVKWTENGSDVSTNASYTFTANAAHNFVAVFEEHASDWDNVTITGVAWNENGVNIDDTDTVRGQVSTADGSDGVALVRSNEMPTVGRVQANDFGHASISGGSFEVHPAAGLVAGNTVWLISTRGTGEDRTIAKVYGLYATFVNA